MNTHRLRWRVAGVSILLALFVAGLRTTVEAPRQNRGQRDRVVEALLRQLEQDPRVRDAVTRSLVERVAGWASAETPRCAECQYALGLRRFYGESDLEGAVEAYLAASELRPGWAWPCNALAIIRFEQGRENEADALWDDAQKKDPAWVRPHNDKAIVYRRAGRLEDAARELQLALAMAPEDPITRYNHGVFLDVTGEHARARAEYEFVLSSRPEMAAAQYNMACSHAREGDLETALPFLVRAIALNDAFREEAGADVDFDPVRRERVFLEVLETPRP